MDFLNPLPTSRILILGGGVTGSALVRFLRSRGVENIYVFDEREISVEAISISTELPAEADLAIVSPGWKKNHPLVLEIQSRGIEILSEVDFAWRVRSVLAPNQRWIALTGTNGKTTTVQMVESIISASHLTGVACGNVGTSVIEAVAKDQPYDVLALELSSFQIEWSNEARFESAAILNIADDHIDWHGSFDEYANAKIKLLNSAQQAVLAGGDPEIVLRSTSWSGPKYFFSLDTPAIGEIGLVENLIVDRAFIKPGADAEVIAELLDINPAVPHNVLNAMAAAGLALSVGISYEAIKRGINEFKPDHHRLEVVHTGQEIEWVNDSKATNPHAAIAALGSYLSIVWIAGGLAKGARMEELAARMGSRIRAAILIGQDRELIAAALKSSAPEVEISYVDKVSTAENLMDEVVAKAKELARPGDTVLLAPACASMDQFNSYAHRGECFVASVKRLVADAS